MNSKSIKEFKSKEWIQFSLRNKKGLLESLPKKKGVYVIKFKKKFCRFKGKSDILYYGSTKDKNGGLWKRISAYFNDPPETQTTNKRIYDELVKYKDQPLNFKISYFKKKGNQDPGGVEKEHLKGYEIKHFELPPWNRSGRK